MSKKTENGGFFITLLTTIVNAVLAVGKTVVGALFYSPALISDGINSIDDVIANIVLVIGMKKSEQKADESHPFGHERFDAVSAIILSIFFFVTGFYVALRGIQMIVKGAYGDLESPEPAAYIVALIAIAIKLTMAVISFIYAKKTKSITVRALALDHLIDVLSTVFTFIGIILAITLEMPILDPIFSLFIAVFIFYTAIVTLKSAISNVTDKSVDKETLEKYRETILSVDGVLGIDEFRTRIFGPRVFVELSISVDRNLSVVEGHNIAEHVHDLMEEKYSDIKHIMVHVNPHEQ
ncbi:MAG: cation diffusion facilitator family transporter [Bacilli bacterium]|jgi:cation diffusion facilitator family transporter